MKIRMMLALLGTLALVATPAHAMNWSLGANLGLVVIDPTEDGVDSATMFGWPSQGFLNAVGAPGLRLGFMGENPQHQFNLETAFWLFSSEGSSISTAQFTGNYQHNFVGSGAATYPFVTGGAGFTSVNAEDFFGGSAVSPTFGIGVGMQHRLGHGHGTARAEIRIDHVVEGEDGGFPLIPASNNIGLKFGFDLWMQ